MEITTPSEPRVREARPAKLNMRGEPVPERKPRAAKPAMPRGKGGQSVTIGRDGKMHVQSAARPVQKPAQRSSGLAKPVQRINRHKKG